MLSRMSPAIRLSSTPIAMVPACLAPEPVVVADSARAGADLKEVAALNDIPARRRYFGGVANLLETIHRMPQPVIARVAGFALAGGMGLAVGCDFAIAADNAEFGLPEITLGLFPMVVI